MIPSHTVHLLKHFSTAGLKDMFPSGNYFRISGIGDLIGQKKKNVKLALHEFVSRIKEDAKFFPCIFLKKHMI